MHWFLYLIGVLWLIMGVSMIFFTEAVSGILATLLEGVNLQGMVGLVPVVFGTLLIISAWWSEALWGFWGVVVLGTMAILKGFFLVFAPAGQVERLKNWWCRGLSELGYRLIGLVVVVLGLFVFAAA